MMKFIVYCRGDPGGRPGYASYIVRATLAGALEAGNWKPITLKSQEEPCPNLTN
jgi:hypothetical protein